MRRAWPLMAVSLGALLVACWDFEQVYDDCVSSGRCTDTGGGGDGGADGGSDAGADAGADGGADAGADAGADGGADAGGGGGNDGGSDGGADPGGCPPGSPTGGGLCLVRSYDTPWTVYGLYGWSPSTIMAGGREESFYVVQSGTITEGNAALGNHVLLGDLDGRGSGDIWAAGSGGFFGESYVYHFNGVDWTNVWPVALDVGACNGVWVEDAGYTLAACDYGLYRVTLAGQTQAVINTSSSGQYFTGVWGLGGNAPAWVVGRDSTGNRSTIRERRGGTWSPLYFPGYALRAVHGTSDRDVWAVGDAAQVLHLTDAGWRSLNPSLTIDFSDVHATSAGEAWMTSYDRRLVVMGQDGGYRSFIAPGMVSDPREIVFQRIQAFDTGDLWVTGTTWDGGYYGGVILHYRKQ